MKKRKTGVGIDIGKHSIKAAWVRSIEGVPSIVKTDILRVPSDTSTLPEVLAQWIKKANLSGVECAIGLHGRDTIFQPFLVAPKDPRTFDQIASLEIVRFNEMASEQMVYDYAPFSLEPADKRFLLAIAKPSVLTDNVKVATEAGLKVVDIIPSPVAMFSPLDLEHGDADIPTIYADVGHSGTTIAIGKKNNLMFARSFASGGNLFTSALSQKLKIPSNQAENIKHFSASLEQGNEHRETLLSAAEMWVSEMNACLSVFGNLIPASRKKPVKMVMTGAGSELRGFSEFVSTSMKIEVVRQSKPAGLSNNMPSSSFAVAAGLAASALQETSTISLLPQAMQDDLFFRKQKPFWIASAIIAVLILAVSVGAGYIDIERKKRILSSQHSDLRDRQELAAQIATIKGRSEMLMQMAAPLNSLIDSGPKVRDLLILLSKSRKDTEFITLVCDADTYFKRETLPAARQGRMRTERVAIKKPEEKKISGISSVIIEGYTKDTSLSNIRTLIATLQDAPGVESADLLSDDNLSVMTPEEEASIGREVIRFAIEIGLKNNATP